MHAILQSLRRLFIGIMLVYVVGMVGLALLWNSEIRDVWWLELSNIFAPYLFVPLLLLIPAGYVLFELNSRGGLVADQGGAFNDPLVFIAPAISCAVSEQADVLFAQDATAADWSKLPFILSERGEARVRLDRWLRRHRLKPAIYAQVSGHEAIVSMVGLGFGVGVVPELVLASSPLRDQVRVVDVQPPLTPFAIGLCAIRQRLDNPLVQAFWDCARASYHQGN